MGLQQVLLVLSGGEVLLQACVSWQAVRQQSLPRFRRPGRAGSRVALPDVVLALV